jgi:hypothetical protein
MSAFLGPIHYWLYNKILLQQEFVNKITEYAENLGYKDYAKTLEEKFGQFDERPLDDIIETSNIHGWLQDKVHIVENKFANAVTDILKDGKGNLADLEAIFEKIGEDKRKELGENETNVTVEEIYKELQDLLLDGMPCDHANSIESSNDGEIVIKRNTCVHHEFWDRIGGDVRNYYTLRESFIKGYIKDLNISYVRIDEDTFSLKIK